jgi:YfiH family protein
MLELADWRDRFGVVAGLAGGPPQTDFNLHRSRPPVPRLDAWHRLGRALVGFDGTVAAYQVHGNVVARHDRAAAGLVLLDGVDGHVTRSDGVLLAVTVADCVPVYLLEVQNGAAGLLHAGWRGVAAGVLEAGVRALVETFSGSPENVAIHCGISICGMCYEVSPEVVCAVTGAAVTTPGPLDLRAALAERAGRLGVREVTVSPWCTAHHAERFYSHRRSAGKDGRMVAFLGRARLKA